MQRNTSYREDAALLQEIQDARESRLGRELASKNPTDLHLLVVAGDMPSNVSVPARQYADFKALVNQQDADGMTPLMYAAQSLKGDMADALKAAGANPALKNKDGQTALDIFEEAYNGDPEALDGEDTANWFRGHLRGGRRRKTRARKTKRRTTRRRR
jgi:hypothetical protein